MDPQAQKQIKTHCVGLGRGRGATDGGRGRAMACRETPGLIRIRLVLRRRAPGARLVEAFETQRNVQRLVDQANVWETFRA